MDAAAANAKKWKFARTNRNAMIVYDLVIGIGTEQVVRYRESGAPTPEAWTGQLVTHYRTELWLGAFDRENRHWFPPTPVCGAPPLESGFCAPVP